MSHLEHGRIGVRKEGHKSKCPWYAAMKVVKYILPYSYKEEIQSLTDIFGESIINGLSVVNPEIKSLIALLENKGDLISHKLAVSLNDQVANLIRKDLRTNN